MEDIRDAQKLDHVPRPCDHFDLIGGTSTGGIIALMLGRLGMTVDECIRAYRKVARRAFTPKRTYTLPASPSGCFSATALEKAIRLITREFCTHELCVNRRRQGKETTDTCPHSDLVFRDKTCTKTVVLAITKSNVDARPTLFQTYDRSTPFEGCTIWEVARATSAATTFFAPISVGRDEVEFIDAGFGYNNPCEELIREAQRVFPGHKELCILSIGAGIGSVVDIGDTRMAIIDALKLIATSSRKVSERLSDRYGDSGQYFRFDVDRGLGDIRLSDWQLSKEISAHTTNYLNENVRIVKRFVDALKGSAQPAGTLRSTSTTAGMLT
ncbi:phosphorylase superfamily protein [Penicillium malachiteum]|uniref:Phosphorylase superfamily protein n=1 Tax=Penicillium malachiteum TaxID=1324776 RepID=A0AAD6N1D7_9EURO|nr:phosphorylase superfamily protein [Penicillium malachiteum]